MFTLDNAITLLTSKKRGEYPTTIQTSRKKAEISADLLLLESKGGPVFNERLVSSIGFFVFFKIYILCRQFLDLAKKVEDEAKHFSLLIQSYGMNKSLPMPTLLPGDLKRCFSICQKDIFSISVYILLCSTATLTLKFTNEVYNEVCMKCTTEVK